MDWIHNFQLFLFDLDGLLVNTEELHYLAYQRMCARHGVKLDWSFEKYCQNAHYHSDAVKEAFEIEFPQLFAKHDWKALYQEKKEEIIALFKEGAVQTMPGVI